MGILGLFGQRAKGPTLRRLPSGCFTVDRENRLLVSTLPQTIPSALIERMGSVVLKAFQSAGNAQVPLREITVHYATIRITARELRGGAIIFMRPLSPGSS